MFGQLLRNAKERPRLFLSECGRRARVLRHRLRRQPDRIDPSSRFVPGFRYGYGEREARGLELLTELLMMGGDIEDAILIDRGESRTQRDRLCVPETSSEFIER
jgi:hypothetical protein